MSRRYSVLGCRGDLLAPPTFLASLSELAAADKLIDIVTLNPEQIMMARRDTAVRSLLERGDLLTIDGVGLAIALRLRGVSGVQRVTGVDLVEALADGGVPTYLLGGTAGAAEEAARRLAERSPNARIVGSWSGGTPREQDDQQSLVRIAASGARAVAVAYGAPAQTEWIERNRVALEEAGVRIAIGVGGTLDYHAGFARRAPSWMRRIGLEWIYRLSAEPWRLRRQLVLPVFAVLAIREAISVRFGRS